MIAVLNPAGQTIARFDSYPEAAAHRLQVCPSWGLGAGGWRIVGVTG